MSDRDRAIFHVLRLCREVSAAEVARRCRRSGRPVSPSTIAKWRRIDGTRYPQHYKLDSVARAFGMKFDLVPARKPHHRTSEQEGRITT